MAPKDWIASFLNKRHLENSLPDGRPLYAYRMEQGEYEELARVLQSSNYMRLEDLAVCRISRWSMAFVLLAAEWWRREYDGGPWKWEPIFEKFGASAVDMTADRRNVAVERGLRSWRRERAIHDDSGKKFIAAIVAEGGLPLRMLAHQNAGHRKLLKSVIGELPRLRQWGETAQDVVRRYSFHLPESLQYEGVYDFLGQLADVTLELVEEFRLTGHDQPVKFLDARSPDWRERFPLELDDENAGRLLKGLVKDAATRKPGGENSFFIRRWLEDRSGDWMIRACLDMPVRKISEEDLRSSLKIDGSSDFPARIDLFLEAEGKLHKAARLKRMHGSNDYRIVPAKGATLSQEAACGEIRLLARGGDKSEMVCITPPGGQDMDEELPWVFAENDGEKKCELLGQGRIHIKAEQCLVALPADARCDKSGVRELSDRGRLRFVAAGKDSVHRLVRLNGDLRVKVHDLWFRVCTGKEKTVADEFAIRGETFPFALSPRQVFVGQPVFCCVRDNGKEEPISAERLMWRWYGTGEKWRKNEHLPEVGLVELALMEDEEVLFRRRVAFLPAGCNVRLEPGSDMTQGKVIFSGFKGVGISPLDRNGCNIVPDKDGSAWWLYTLAKVVPPADVVFEISPPHCNPIHVKIPFPVRGARFFTDEVPLTQGEQVFVRHLHGVHARLFRLDDGKRSQIGLVASLSEKGNIFFRRRKCWKGGYEEVRLVEYREELEELLTATDMFDAEVDVSVEIDGNRCASIILRKFECKLYRDEVEGIVCIDGEAMRQLSLDELKSTHVMATYLMCPEEKPVELEAVLSNGVPTGQWRFDPQGRRAGSWLIFPGRDSDVVFRPIVWEVDGEVRCIAKDSLRSVSSIMGQEKREKEYDRQIEKLVLDGSGKGWNFIQKTLDRFGHLPFSSYDLFRCMTHNADAMAAMFMLCEFDEWEDFTKELPFMWERVSFVSWRKAIDLLSSKRFCRDRGEKVSDELLKILLTEKLDSLKELVPAFHVGMEFFKRHAALPHYERMPPNPERWFMDSLFAGADSEIQKLMRDMTGEWPEHFFCNLPDWVKNIPDWSKELFDGAHKYCDTWEEEYRRPVILMPLILGVEWIEGRYLAYPPDGMGESEFLYRINELRHFHEEWFNKAMKWTIGHGLAKKYKEE